jgi:hypothetical protein
MNGLFKQAILIIMYEGLISLFFLNDKLCVGLKAGLHNEL